MALSPKPPAPAPPSGPKVQAAAPPPADLAARPLLLILHWDQRRDQRLDQHWDQAGKLPELAPPLAERLQVLRQSAHEFWQPDGAPAKAADLLLLDLGATAPTPPRIAEVSGFVRRLRAQALTRSVPLAAWYAGEASEALEAPLLQSGCTAVWTPPCSPALLAERIAAHLLVRREGERWLPGHGAAAGGTRNWSDIFARASHDLREPVRGILSFSRLLAGHPSIAGQSEPEEYLGFIREGAERIGSLVEAVTYWLRASLGLANQASVELATLLAAARVNLMRPGEPRGPGFAEPLLAPAGIRVSGDLRQLEWLLTELLRNAQKFSHATDGRVMDVPVEIRAELVKEAKADAEADAGANADAEAKPESKVEAEAGVGTRVRITIRDRGVGIPESFRPRLFTPFSRQHARSLYPGNGLGLVTCALIANHHGGELVVEPEADGTAVHLWLPASAEGM